VHSRGKGRRAVATCVLLLLSSLRLGAVQRVALVDIAGLRLLSAIGTLSGWSGEDQYTWVWIVEAFVRGGQSVERRSYQAGVVYFVAGQEEQALAAWRLSEASVDSLVGLGDYYGTRGALSKMASAYQLVLELDPHNSRALCRLGEYYREVERPQIALALLAAAAVRGDFGGRSGEAAECHYLLGETLALSGDWEDAVSHFATAADLRPDTGRYRLGLARALYFGRHDPSAAFALLQSSVGPSSDDIWAHLIVADMRMREGEPAAAIGSANRALSISPASAWSYVYRGRVYLEAGSAAVAGRDFRLAVALDRMNADAHCNLGMAYLELERHSEAIREMLVGTCIAPGKRWCQLELGRAYEIVGEQEQAIGAYERVLELDPENGEARERLAVLRGSR
jgi:protein O-GlcNAc transferase